MSRQKVNAQSEESEVIHIAKNHNEVKVIKYDKDATIGVRGIVHIFNNFEFDPPNLHNFKGGDKAGTQLKKVFSKLEYKVKIHNNLTKDETDKAFVDIQRTEGLEKENVLIFFILSHGKGEFIYYTSDGQKINLKEKMQMFRGDEESCPAMAYRPKIWFGEFCRGKGKQRGVSWHEKKTRDGDSEFEWVKCYGSEEVLTNTQYSMSSSEGSISVGDKFNHAVSDMFNEDNYQLDDKWFSDLNIKLRIGEAPNSVRHIYGPFPGQLFDGKFSFNYNIKEVDARKSQNLGTGKRIESPVKAINLESKVKDISLKTKLKK